MITAFVTLLAVAAAFDSDTQGGKVVPVKDSPYCVRVMQTNAGKVQDLDLSPDGARVVVGCENGHAFVYTLATGALEADLFVSSGWAWDVEFDPTGTRIAVVQPTLTRLWNAKTFELERTLEEQRLGMFHACFSPDGRLIATGSIGDTAKHDEVTEARVWDVANGTLIASVANLGSRVRPSFRPDGKALLLNSESNEGLSVMQLDEAPTTRKLVNRDTRVAFAAWSPDGKKVLSVTTDYCGRVWNAEDARVIHVLRGHTGYLVECAFSPDGKEVSTTSWADRTTRIWNVVTGKERLVLSGHTDRPVRTKFAPNGRSFASVDASGHGILFDLRQGNVAANYDGHEGIVAGLAFTPDSKLVVTGAGDGAVRVWKNPLAK